MRRWAILAGVLMLTVLLSPAVLGFNGWGDEDAYYMVITYGAGDYSVGDEITVTVHVFEAGDYVDMDNVTLMAGYDWFGTTRELDLTRTATGRYQATFTITQDDLFETWLYLTATVEEGGVPVEEAYTMVTMDRAEVREYLAVTYRVDPPGSYASPGQTKTITWEFRHDGNLVDPTRMEASVDDRSGYESIDPVKQSKGVYTYQYAMSSGPQSVQADIDCYAEYEVGNETLEGEAEVELYLVHLHVWAKRLGPVSATSASFDLFVSNSSGSPVEGANISLEYSYDSNSGRYVEKMAYGTTDADGRATVELAYNDLEDTEDTVSIDGRVTGQGKEQAIEFDMNVRPPAGDELPPPEDFGLDVIPHKEMFDFDKDVTLACDAYYDAEPLGTSTVYWYVSSPNKVLSKGTADTTLQGRFTAGFKTPAKGSSPYEAIIAHFETPVEDGTVEYYEDDEYLAVTSLGEGGLPDTYLDALQMFRDRSVKVEWGKLVKSKPVPVTVTYSKADPEWMVAVIVGNEPDVQAMERVPTWSYWSQSPMEGLYGDICYYEDGKWKGEVFIPENLPKKDFFVAALLVNMNALSSGSITDYEQWVKSNYVDGVEVGQTGSSDDGGGPLDTLMDTTILGVPILYWIFILIILAAAVVIAVAVARRRGPPKKMEEPGLEPAEGPSFPGEYGPAQMPMPAPSYEQMQPMPGQAHYHEGPPTEPSYEQPMYGAPAYQEPSYQEPPPPPQPEYQQPMAPPPQPEYQQPMAPQPPPAPPTPEAPPAYQPPGQPAPSAYQPPQAPPAAMPPPVPQAPPPYAPPPPAPQAPPPAAPAPPAPQAPPPAAPAAPPAAPVAQPPAAAPAAVTASATMTIRCQKCQTTLTIPRKRPIKVTCPNCGASGVLK